MSACSAQAISHVGCRLMVASRANTSRPRAPAACGDIALALATKAAISSEADAGASGNAFPDAAFGVEDTSVADLGLVGSPDISARRVLQALCGPRLGDGQCAGAPPVHLVRGFGAAGLEAAAASVLERRGRCGRCGRLRRHERRDRTGIGHERRRPGCLLYTSDAADDLLCVDL